MKKNLALNENKNSYSEHTFDSLIDLGKMAKEEIEEEEDDSAVMEFKEKDIKAIQKKKKGSKVTQVLKGAIGKYFTDDAHRTIEEASEGNSNSDEEVKTQTNQGRKEGKLDY